MHLAFLGIDCRSDSDCNANLTCDLTRNKCNYTIDHIIDVCSVCINAWVALDDRCVVQCWADNLSMEVSAALFDLWGIEEVVNRATFRAAVLSRFGRQLCTGHNSHLYRRGLTHACSHASQLSYTSPIGRTCG